MYQGPRREPEIDLEQILAKVRSLIGKLTGGRSGKGNISGYLTLGVLVGALLVWLGTGVYQVSPGEMAVVRTFGKCCNSAGPGLHWYWPAPIGTRNIESVDRVRSMELGFSTLRGGNADIPEEADRTEGGAKTERGGCGQLAADLIEGVPLSGHHLAPPGIFSDLARSNS